MVRQPLEEGGVRAGLRVVPPPVAPQRLEDVLAEHHGSREQAGSQAKVAGVEPGDPQRLPPERSDPRRRVSPRQQEKGQQHKQGFCDCYHDNADDRGSSRQQTAVVPKPDEIRGQVPVAFIVLKPGVKASPKVQDSIVKQVRKQIGPTAKPHQIYFVKGLPKTRSGKIMRRFLRSMLVNEKLGDATTLQNPEIVPYLKKLVGYRKK